ncbi:hypothetical protein LLH00_13355 [bacterium]|nr:hypothetical protein [bacterium]
MSVAEWKDSLALTFSAAALKAALDNPAGAEGLELFRPLAAQWLRDVSRPAWPAWRPDCGLTDPAGGRFFAAGAAEEGLGCFELSTGCKLWSLPGGTLGRAGGMALASGGLYVCDRWNNRVLRLDPQSGKELGRFEHSAPGRLLDDPSDILTLETDNGPELWVCERGNHHISRLDTQGGFLGWIGSRGLEVEETVRRFSGPEAERGKPMFEFPETLSIAPDIDGIQTIFVWDSFNGRIVLLAVDGSLKRSFSLRGPDTAKFCGQVRVLGFRGGPLALGVDDVSNTLKIWDHEGLLLLSLSLEDWNPTSGRAERARVAPGTEGPLLLSSRGRAFVLAGPAADPESLLHNLINIFPERAELRLSLAERLSAAGLEPDWGALLKGFKPETAVDELVCLAGVLDRSLERTVNRLAILAGRLELAGNKETATGIKTALRGRLEALTADLTAALLTAGRPEPSSLKRWSDARADLDMALIRTKGREQKEEMALDDFLEEIREAPEHTRRTAWGLRALCTLAGSQSAPDFTIDRDRLAAQADALRRERLNLVLALAGQVELAGDPAHVLRDELVQIHRTLLAAEAAERVAVHLTECARAAGLPDRRVAAEGISLPQPQAADYQSALASFQSLVDNMARYLKALNDAGGTGGPFGRVVVRQREIFALKASLLVNSLCGNGSTPAEALELAEKAGRLAGTAWSATANLRFTHSPAENP